MVFFDDFKKSHNTSVPVSSKISQDAALRRSELVVLDNSNNFVPATVSNTGPRPEYTANGKTDSQQRKYKTHSTECLRFCELIDDDLSGLAFDDANRPKNPVPPDPDMVLALLMFKCNTPNIILTYKGSPVRRKSGGEVIKCVGAWKCHSNIDSFKGMFNFLAARFPSLSGGHRLACASCIELRNNSTEQHQKMGCTEHAGKPHLISKGNVIKHPIVASELERWRKAMERGHQRRGNYALTPAELRRIFNYCMSSGDETFFQVYVMMLCGVKLFLRCQEVLDMKVEDFITKMFQVDLEGGVRTLVTKVQGKTDAKPVYLNIFRELFSSQKEFDLIPLLLAYIKSFGIKDGYLFRASRGSENPISYKVFLSKIEFLLKHILKKDPKMVCMGTHTLRKTAYLFASWSLLQICGSWGG